MADNKFHTQRVLGNVQKLLHGELPVLLANQAENFFVESFKKSAWVDGSSTAWPKRQSENSRSAGRKLLVKSGALRRAVGNAIRSQVFEKVQLVVALPYAAVHNDGYYGTRRAHLRATFNKSIQTANIGLKQAGKGPKRRTAIFTKTGDTQVKAHNMRMPRRRFMGDSATLRGMQKKLILKQIDKVWQA